MPDTFSPLDFLEDSEPVTMKYRMEQARARRAEQEALDAQKHGQKRHCSRCGKVMRTTTNPAYGGRDPRMYCFDCTDLFKGDI